LRGFGVGPVLDALHGLEVELDPLALVLRVDKRVGVRAEAIDVAKALREPAIGHQDGDLVQALGRIGQAPQRRSPRSQRIRPITQALDSIGLLASSLSGLAPRDPLLAVVAECLLDRGPVLLLGGRQL